MTLALSLSLLLRYWRGVWRPVVVDEARVRRLVEQAMGLCRCEAARQQHAWAYHCPIHGIVRFGQFLGGVEQANVE